MKDLRWDRITDEQTLRKHIMWLNANTKYAVCDTETTNEDPHKAELVDIQVSGRDDKHVIIFPAPLAPVLLDLNVTLVWQNMKYDLIVLHRHGVDLRNKRHRDIMLIEHLLDENMFSYALPALIKKHAGADVGYKNDFWDKYKTYLGAPEVARYDYGAEDIYWTGFIYRSQMKDIREGALG